MTKEYITFCGVECEVVKRYEVSEEYAKENNLSYRKRIIFKTSDGNEIDCADTF